MKKITIQLAVTVMTFGPTVSAQENTLVTLGVPIVTEDDFVTGIPAIDESIRISVIFAGVFFALLGVLVFSIYISLLVTEFRKARR